jgi:hypothetical protein
VLSRIYGLRWADVEHMPAGELDAYLDDLDALARS